MFDRLWFRLLLGMSVALALAVGTVAVLMRAATEDSFDAYVENVSTARALRVENVLTRQYQRQRSWSGVEPVVRLVADLAGQRVVLADSQGRVVADSQDRLVGQRVQSTWSGDPIIITYQEQPVGSVYLDPLHSANEVDSRAQAFLTLTNQYLAWAAAVGVLAALILSLLLARWLVAPLEALTRAARRMEQGDLSQTIDVRIGGEIGALAQAFNSTARSLARLERLRQQMVADIAHELRTPLTNVRGYLEAIQDGVVQPDDETLGIMEHELSQLTRLVEDLQELALVEAGQLKLSRGEVDLRELVNLEVRALRPRAEGLGVDLVYRFGANVPIISADAVRLGQILRNILRNALAHTGPGGRITTRVVADDRSVLVRIKDTGSGILPEDLPHVFERFYRGDKARARQESGLENSTGQGHGGYGLGLTICRELVQAHGGQISATSTLGQGTEFTIRLPIEAPLAAPTAEEPIAAAPAAPIPRLRRRELLWYGVIVSAFFGAIAGLTETGLLAIGVRRARSFVDFFGYAVLIDAAVFAALGLIATAAAILLARLLRRPLDVRRQIAVLAPVGCLLIGLVSYLRWKQLFNRDDSLAMPQALFAQVVIFGLATWLALLSGALLGSPRGASRARFFARRVAPLALVLLVSVATFGIVRDLGERGVIPGAEVLAEGVDSPNPEAGPAGLPPSAMVSSASPTAQGSSPPGEPGPSVAASSQPTRPNVLFVTIESLRADHVGVYGYGQARTATIDRLAGQGVRFANFVANQGHTNPVHASMFTGTYPATHGVRSDLMEQLPDSLPTLAESFAGQGYATAGLFSWPSLEPAYSGLQRGFEHYADLVVNRPGYLVDSRASGLAATYERVKSMLALPGAVDAAAGTQQVGAGFDGKANVTTDGALDWLQQHQARARASGQPFFLWVHYFDPHYPYTPPPPFDQIEPDDCTDCLDGGVEAIRRLQADDGPSFSAAQVNRLLQYYDGEVTFTDQELGRLLARLEQLGLASNTLVVVVGSHGESFGEHGRWLNGNGVQDTELQVPLILSFPGRLPAGTVVQQVGQQIDLMPTILDLTGLEIPPAVEGQSLLPLAQNPLAGADRFAVAESSDRSQVSIITRQWRFLKSLDSGEVDLYLTADDPNSLRDLADEEPAVVAEFEHLLESWRQQHP
jgi:signal transduction histidine kinase/arylsulfatase A-like enzyme